MRYAVIVAATGNYVPYLTALLNSIEKVQLWDHLGNADLHVYVLYHGFEPAWDFFERARILSFDVQGVELRRADIPHPSDMSTKEFVKRARYFKLYEIGREYDVICLMDADMYLVAPEFGALFDLVRGTRRLIGCNERFKWKVGPSDYFLEGKPICGERGELHAMICNVPTLFDAREWTDVLEWYHRIGFYGYQSGGGKRRGIGDLFAFNLAVHRCGRQSDIVMFPMSVMTQVHHTWAKPWTHLINSSGRWRTWAGDRVYCIHGRVAQAGFVAGNMEKYRADWSGWRDLEAFAPRVEEGLRAVQREWYELAVKGRLSVYEFLPRNAEWDTFVR